MRRSARALGGRAAAGWGATPTARTTAHLISAVGDDQGVEPAWSVIAANSPLPSCVTLV